MGLPRREDWSGLPFPSPGDLSDGIVLWLKRSQLRCYLLPGAAWRRHCPEVWRFRGLTIRIRNRLSETMSLSSAGSVCACLSPQQLPVCSGSLLPPMSLCPQEALHWLLHLHEFPFLQSIIIPHRKECELRGFFVQNKTLKANSLNFWDIQQTVAPFLVHARI